jgi:Mg2+-importing ATPase
LKLYEAKSSETLAAVANLPLSEYLEQVNSTLAGLTDYEAARRLADSGPNTLSTAKSRRWWSILLECIPNPFVVLLTVLAIISIATQQQATFVILMIMVIISVGIRFWQELKSNVAMNELVTLVHDDVFVIRETIDKKIPKSNLVVGDLVRLGGGDMVPADVLLIDTAGLYISQSTLTGEGLPVLKQLTDDSGSQPIATAGSILECPRICFAGTSITSGNGIGIVVATGDGTRAPSALTPARCIGAFVIWSDMQTPTSVLLHVV